MITYWEADHRSRLASMGSSGLIPSVRNQTIGSIQLGSAVSYSISSARSILGCSRFSTNVFSKESKAEVASLESASARAFSVLGMWEILKYLRHVTRSFTF